MRRIQSAQSLMSLFNFLRAPGHRVSNSTRQHTWDTTEYEHMREARDTKEAWARVNLKSTQDIRKSRHALAAWETIITLDAGDLRKSPPRHAFQYQTGIVQGIVRTGFEGHAGLDHLDVLLLCGTYVSFTELCDGVVGRTMIQDALDITQMELENLLMQTDPMLFLEHSPEIRDFRIYEEMEDRFLFGRTVGGCEMQIYRTQIKASNTGRQLLQNWRSERKRRG